MRRVLLRGIWSGREKLDTLKSHPVVVAKHLCGVARILGVSGACDLHTRSDMIGSHILLNKGVQ